MKQVSDMPKPGLTVAGFATGGLIYLLFASNQPSWGYQVGSLLGSEINQPLALASMLKGYQPSGNSTSPRRTTGGGTRGGCDGQSAVNVTALAPQAHMGQTISTRPTLTWFVTDETPYPIELQLYRYSSSDPTDDRLELVDIFDLGESQPGWMALTLPPTMAPLEVGETYRWKVILKCSPSQPSRNRIDEADLQVVPPPANIAVVGDAVQQAEQYLSLGFWYDGIAALSKVPVSAAATAYRREVISSLAELEAENPNDPISLFSDRLRYIADQD